MPHDAGTCTTVHETPAGMLYLRPSTLRPWQILFMHQSMLFIVPDVQISKHVKMVGIAVMGWLFTTHPCCNVLSLFSRETDQMLLLTICVWFRIMDYSILIYLFISDTAICDLDIVSIVAIAIVASHSLWVHFLFTELRFSVYSLDVGVVAAMDRHSWYKDGCWH